MMGIQSSGVLLIYWLLSFVAALVMFSSKIQHALEKVSEITCLYTVQGYKVSKQQGYFCLIDCKGENQIPLFKIRAEKNDWWHFIFVMDVLFAALEHEKLFLCWLNMKVLASFSPVFCSLGLPGRPFPPCHNLPLCLPGARRTCVILLSWSPSLLLWSWQQSCK